MKEHVKENANLSPSSIYKIEKAETQTGGEVIGIYEKRYNSKWKSVKLTIRWQDGTISRMKQNEFISWGKILNK